MSRRIKIFAHTPVRSHIYALVPYGMYFNKDIPKARRGDIISFSEGWRTVKMQFVRGCVVKVGSPMFTFLLKSLYRGWNTADVFFSEYEAICLNEGYGKKAFSRDEVMLIEIKEIEDGKKKAEIRE